MKLSGCSILLEVMANSQILGAATGFSVQTDGKNGFESGAGGINSRFVRSRLVAREDAPKQGSEGAPDAWVDIDPAFAEALQGVAAGQELILLTWLHQGRRDVLKVRPRDDPMNPLTGVFATRSSDRPNPIGLHRVRVLEIVESRRLRVEPLEAVDGTPVVDLKSVLPGSIGA